MTRTFGKLHGRYPSLVSDGNMEITLHDSPNAQLLTTLEKLVLDKTPRCLYRPVLLLAPGREHVRTMMLLA